MQGSLKIEQMCRMTGVSRAGFYRDWQEKQPVEEEMEVRSAIQKIALEHRRRYGYRRIGRQLWEEHGLRVNPKRILRILREEDLLGLQPRRFVQTTDSSHELQVYWNLARHLRLTGINQLWVADITYIRLQKEFVYLAVVLDAYSRKVVGWALSRSLSRELPLAALKRALEERQPAAGLVHHSDRGLQYASADYGEMLRRHGIEISMSRAGNPYDNALCESFLKTLKREEIYCTEYGDLEHLEANLEIFIEQYYNRRRLHSALKYCSPEEFEQNLAAKATSGVRAVPRLSFRGMGQSINAMGSSPSPGPKLLPDSLP